MKATLFLLPGCCDPFNEKALQASRGASFQLPIVSGTWTRLEALRNKFHLKILAGHPESNEQSKPVSRLSQGLADSLANLPLCLVLGGEGSGLSAKTRQLQGDTPTQPQSVNPSLKAAAQDGSNGYQTTLTNLFSGQHSVDGLKGFDQMVDDYLQKPSNFGQEKGIHRDELSQKLKTIAYWHCVPLIVRD